ncbi:MAG: ATP-binding protein [Bacteroidales bacterium]
MWENIQVKRLAEGFMPDSSDRIIFLLTGARQTGKTTLLQKKYDGLPYFNLDAIEYREQLKAISSFSWGETVGDAVIDEIQKESGLIDKIKYAWDGGQIRFTAMSGSAQVMLMRQTRETLAGRVFIIELFPLLLSELLAGGKGNFTTHPLSLIASGEDTDIIIGKMKPVLLGSEWENRINSEEYLLKWGGMPSLLHLEEKKRSDWLKDYTHTYLERDLGDLARINDLMPFKRFQKLAALRTAGLISYSDLARDAGLGIETARRYLEYLRLSYQAFLLQPYHKNLTSSLVKTPKLYWTDNGLLRQLSGLGFDISSGELYENYVASEIMKCLRTSRSDASLSFYRTRSGMEVDFCMEIKGKLLAIESKNRTTVAVSDFTSLKRLRDASGRNWLGGIVLYRGNKIMRIEDTIWAMPSCRFFG